MRCPCSHQAARGPWAAGLCAFRFCLFAQECGVAQQGLACICAVRSRRKGKLTLLPCCMAGLWKPWRCLGRSPTAQSVTSCTRWSPLMQCFTPCGAQICPGVRATARRSASPGKLRRCCSVKPRSCVSMQVHIWPEALQLAKQTAAHWLSALRSALPLGSVSFHHAAQRVSALRPPSVSS